MVRGVGVGGYGQLGVYDGAYVVHTQSMTDPRPGSVCTVHV